MTSIKRLRPSPALFVAMAALVMAMSGVAAALPGKGSVQKNDIAKGAVTTKAIAKGAVKTKVIARGAIGSKQIKGKSIRGNRIKDRGIKSKQLADGAVGEKQLADLGVTGAKVANETLDSTKISDYAVISSPAGNFVKLTATEGPSEAAARIAAPSTELFGKGQIAISAKCFRDTVADATFAEIYVASSASGAIFDGSTDELSGGNAPTDFLNPGTPETDRVLDDAIATAATPALMDEGEFNVVGVDGTHLLGQTTVAAKNGALAAGDGVYGAGNVCLFGGEISG